MSLPLPESDRRTLASILMDESGELTPETLESAFATLRERRLKLRRAELLAELVTAERKGDAATLARLAGEKMQLDREIQAMQQVGD